MFAILRNIALRKNGFKPTAARLPAWPVRYFLRCSSRNFSNFFKLNLFQNISKTCGYHKQSTKFFDFLTLKYPCTSLSIHLGDTVCCGYYNLRGLAGLVS